MRLFAVLRERAGAGSVQLELPEGARVADALEELGSLAEGLPLVMAVNREYAPEDQVLGEGDELALIPPVSGGSGEPWARVTADPLSVSDVSERVTDPRAGAVVTFSGVTRDVDKLEYEAYEEMATERLRSIAAEAVESHGLCAAAVEHRVGDVPLSEPSVVVAASAPHREEAFAGAREIIDRAKAEAPIWKREVEGGEGRWVEGAEPDRARAAAGSARPGRWPAGGPGGRSAGWAAASGRPLRSTSARSRPSPAPCPVGARSGLGRGGVLPDPGPPGSTATPTTSLTVAPCGGSLRSPSR